MDDSGTITISSLEAKRLENMMEMYMKYQEEFGEDDCEKEIEIKPPKIMRKRKSFVIRRSLKPTRRSSRISGEKAADYYDMEDEDETEYVEAKKRKSSTPRIVFHRPREIKKMEDITEDEISRIWYKSSGKTYSIQGSTCHQCRQKTIDTKSICWSKECSGVRGQFCGFCLQNRYGEDVASTLRNPDWVCPPCRDICNCSICRTRNGKMPTGILAPYVKSDGFKSVKEFLENREGKLDHDERKSKREDNKENIDQEGEDNSGQEDEEKSDQEDKEKSDQEDEEKSDQEDEEKNDREEQKIIDEEGKEKCCREEKETIDEEETDRDEEESDRED